MLRVGQDSRRIKSYLFLFGMVVLAGCNLSVQDMTRKKDDTVVKHNSEKENVSKKENVNEKKEIKVKKESTAVIPVTKVEPSTLEIKTIKRDLTSIEVRKEQSKQGKLLCRKGMPFPKEKINVVGAYSDGQSLEVEYEIKNFDKNRMGEQVVVIQSGEQSVQLSVYVAPSLAEQRKMVKVNSEMEVGKYPVTNELWNTVGKWANKNQYVISIRKRRGSFDENFLWKPVTNVSWKEAVVWCNAYSEWCKTTQEGQVGCSPVYFYNNHAVKKVDEIEIFDRVRREWEEKGCRLLTQKEWRSAAGMQDRPKAKRLRSNSVGDNKESPTKSIIEMKGNTQGIYGMGGDHIWEWTATPLGRRYDCIVYGGKDNMEETGNAMASSKYSNIGFRVCRSLK